MKGAKVAPTRRRPIFSLSRAVGAMGMGSMGAVGPVVEEEGLAQLKYEQEAQY